jgi:hypothetical protein
VVVVVPIFNNSGYHSHDLLAGGIVVESIAGSPYGFSVWSTQLQAQLNYTQSEIETVGSIGNIGQYTAIFAGLAYDAWGPRITGVIGAMLSVVGYGEGRGFPTPPDHLMCLHCA